MKRPRRIASASPFFDERSIDGILREIAQSLRVGVLTDGPHTKRFEEEFAKYINVKYAVAVSSGTAALEIALRYFGLNGSEVIVPTNTFVATPASVLLSGGKPVFVDTDAETLCIDIEDVKKKITSRTAGVIVVHTAGLVCPQIDELRDLCARKNLFLLEDAAHAHGAAIEGRKAGSLADGGAFSFYPTKIMTTGHGGMITTNNQELAEAAVSIRNHGLDSQRIMKLIGDNWCMSEITAVIGTYQLASLEGFVRKRNKIAKWYEELLTSAKEVSVFKVPSNIRHSYYKFAVLLSDNLNTKMIADAMRTKFGVETGGIYYPPCHLHPWFLMNLGTREGDLPVSEVVLRQVLCLPMHVGITKQTADYVVKSLKACVS